MTTQKSITAIVDELLQQLRTTYTKACSALDKEHLALEGESLQLQTTANELRLLLPAKARRAARDADDLLLAGQHEKAQAKRDEQIQAENAPGEMEQRRRTIAERIGAIDSEKRAIARHVFQEWLPGFRAALVEEQQTLCTALDNAWAGVQNFAGDTAQPAILTANLPSDLTACPRREPDTFKEIELWFGSGQENPWSRAKKGAA